MRIVFAWLVCGFFACSRATEPASIHVTSNMRESVLFVNAHEHGPLASAVDIELLPGSHVLEARLGDRVLASVHLDVTPGEHRTVALDVNAPRIAPDQRAAEPPPPASPEPAIAEPPVEPPVTPTAPDPAALLGTAPATEPNEGRTLDVATLSATLGTNRRALARCYQTTLRNAQGQAPSARFRITVTIGGDGRVTRASAEGEGPSDLRRCLEREARAFVFPATGETAEMTFPVAFHSSD